MTDLFEMGPNGICRQIGWSGVRENKESRVTPEVWIE